MEEGVLGMVGEHWRIGSPAYPISHRLWAQSWTLGNIIQGKLFRVF